jgi:hypothetical protein
MTFFNNNNTTTTVKQIIKQEGGDLFMMNQASLLTELLINQLGMKHLNLITKLNKHYMNTYIKLPELLRPRFTHLNFLERLQKQEYTPIIKTIKIKK